MDSFRIAVIKKIN